MPTRQPTLESLGVAIAEARRERGLTQKDLAEISGLNRGYLAGIESGQRNLGFLNLVKVAEALRLSAAELLTRAQR